MKTAVVTIAAGSRIEPIARLSFPLMIKYADRIGSDFISLSPVYSDRFLGVVNYEKLQVLDLLEYYERVAFIDADTLVSSKAPSLFDIVEKDALGVFIASRYSDGHNPSVKAIQDALGEIDWRREDRNHEIYESFNSGVLVLSSITGKVFSRDLHLADKWARANSKREYMSDQTFLNYIAQKHCLPLFDIGYKYNHTLASLNSEKRFRSHIIHYAGNSHRESNLFRQPNKAAKMKHDNWILSSNFLSHIATHFPPAVSFLDLLL